MLKLLARAQDKPSFFVSQALNTTFHAPARMPHFHPSIPLSTMGLEVVNTLAHAAVTEVCLLLRMHPLLWV